MFLQGAARCVPAQTKARAARFDETEPAVTNSKAASTAPIPQRRDGRYNVQITGRLLAATLRGYCLETLTKYRSVATSNSFFFRGVFIVCQ